MTSHSMQSRMLAVSALSTGFSLISSAFGFYYVKVFLNIYHVEQSWFNIAQTLFMFWNAINDPLFAYLQDTTNFRFSRTRREGVLYAAPFFAISFLVPWFPWGDTKTVAAWVTGLHLIVSLCLWDTMFTYVGLAYCCLFTEISKDNVDRLKMVRYTQIGGLLGSSSVFIIQHMSGQLEDFQAFQITCAVIAVFSYLLMRYCGKNAHTERELANQEASRTGTQQITKTSTYSYITLVKQICINRDFVAFVIMNFFTEFLRTFLSNFFAIFADQLIVAGTISPFTRSVFYGISHPLSKMITIIGTPIVTKLGYFKVIRYSQIVLIVLGFLYFVIGPINHYMLLLFMVAVSCTTDGTFALYNLPLSDIADKDLVRYNRGHPVTSMVYGSNALVVKPAISLSPMFVVSILNSYGYEKLKENKLDPTQSDIMNDVMFNMLCLFPCVIGCIQFASWSFYTIRDKKDIDVTVLVSIDGEGEENV